MSKPYNVYRCDHCKALFEVEGYNSPGGIAVYLETTSYGNGLEHYQLDHVCDSCRSRLAKLLATVFPPPAADLPEPGKEE